MYQLKYLPIAMRDMAEIARYISLDLFNPSAAQKLAEEMIKAAEMLTEFPYSNAIHFSIKPFKQEYRKLFVKNYVMFYWIDEKKKQVTIARVVYARRDYEKLFD